MLSIFAIAFFLIKIIEVLFVSDEFWMLNQILYSVELDNVSSQPMTNDHPVISSPASTDVTNPSDNSYDDHPVISSPASTDVTNPSDNPYDDHPVISSPASTDVMIQVMTLMTTIQSSQDQLEPM
uniref:H-orf protein n=1 Tax=Lasmigona compressa TaxID=85051 RepID=F4ZFW6_LASCM|nr:h-orf protein [Lasmigona compressa]